MEGIQRIYFSYFFVSHLNDYGDSSRIVIEIRVKVNHPPVSMQRGIKETSKRLKYVIYSVSLKCT